MSQTTNQETHRFETEVEQLLHLMVHSLYSNKEIFLRELISNAADACDKLRFEALKDSALFERDTELAVSVAYDREARTVTVSDNGIGMSRAEVVDNIGTIARSGTRRFLESMTGEQAKDTRLIGQFGVGFYSVFIVSDQVTLTTRRAGSEHGVRWSSDGQGEYTLADVDKAERGTTVTLHLKEGEDEFLDGARLRHIIRTYSDHIDLPIRMQKETQEDEATGEMETVNRAAALWTRPKSEISEEDYKSFYKSVTHDVEDPLAWSHNRVEGKLEYTSLLYIPQRAPFDLWDPERRRGVKLYVRRIFIMDDADHLMPRYLRFVRGIIDSADLPLNVSRELLQSNRAIDVMRAGSVKKVLGLLEDMANKEPEKYTTFWKEFGRVLKEGPAEDAGNRERIAGLLRFASTHADNDTQNVSLKDYIKRMRAGQTAIYYLTADSFTAVKHSPHLEVFRKNNIEVLLLSERVDEWLMSHLTEFDGKPLKSVSKGDLDNDELVGAKEAKPEEQDDKELNTFLERVKDALGERVEAVRVSHRLTDSPACVVAAQDAMSLNLERLLKEAGQPVPQSRPILELNLDHAMVKRVRAEAEQSQFRQWSELLLDQAVLAEGGQLKDPARFVQRMNQLLLKVAATPH